MNTKITKEEYCVSVNNVLRNVKLSSSDISDGVLTESFFKRKDISEHKIEVLKDLNNRLGKK